MSGYSSETNNLVLRNTTNQLTLGESAYGGFSTTLSCAAPSANRTYTISDAGANVNLLTGVSTVTAITTTAAPAVTASGTVYSVSCPGGSTYNITLPAPASGVNFTFIVGAAIGHAVTLKSNAANVYGNIVSSDGTAVTSGNITSAITNVVLGSTAAVGDKYTYISDGTNYYVFGSTGTHGSVTFS